MEMNPISLQSFQQQPTVGSFEFVPLFVNVTQQQRPVINNIMNTLKLRTVSSSVKQEFTQCEALFYFSYMETLDMSSLSSD